MPDYSTLVTLAGQSAFAAAIANATPVNITAMTVGDSNGVGYDPDENQTALVNERYSSTDISVSVEAGGIIAVEMTIPANVGGWHVREAAIEADDGTVLAIMRYPDSYKPAPSSSIASVKTITMKLDVGNTNAVAWSIDSASKDKIDQQLRPDFRSVNGISNTPATSPDAGDTWIVGTSPTDAWAGKGNQLAEWSGTGWVFVAPTDWMLVSLPDKTDRRWDHTLGTPAWITPSSAHSHVINDVTGLQTALDGKAPAVHTHTIAQVTGLQTALDGKLADRLNLATLPEQVTDWNAAETFGLHYSLSTALNSPAVATHVGLVLPLSSANIVQLLWRVASGSVSQASTFSYRRDKIGGAWGNWYKVNLSETEILALIAANAPQGLGQGQTWQNVTGSRVQGTVYQNTTGKPIEVAVSMYMVTNSDESWSLDVSADNATWIVAGKHWLDHVTSGVTGSGGQVCAVVPNNHFYRFTNSKPAAATPANWSELR